MINLKKWVDKLTQEAMEDQELRDGIKRLYKWMRTSPEEKDKLIEKRYKDESEPT